METLRDKLKGRVKSPARVEPVPTPEWPEFDGQVFVPVVSAKRMDGWYDRLGDGNSRALYAASFACDAVGNRLFTDEDAGWLGEEPFTVIDRIFAAGMTLNRSTPAAREELRKNSETATDGGDSLSSSQER